MEGSTGYKLTHTEPVILEDANRKLILASLHISYDLIIMHQHHELITCSSFPPPPKSKRHFADILTPGMKDCL